MSEPCKGCPPPLPQPAKEVVAVKVWYVDAVYEDPDWSELPELGFQVGMLYFADGSRRIMSGNDYYFVAPGPNGTIYGQTDHVEQLENYPGRVVVRGQWTDDATFAALTEEAMSEG